LGQFVGGRVGVLGLAYEPVEKGEPIGQRHVLAFGLGVEEVDVLVDVGEQVLHVDVGELAVDVEVVHQDGVFLEDRATLGLQLGRLQ